MLKKGAVILTLILIGVALLILRNDAQTIRNDDKKNLIHRTITVGGVKRDYFIFVPFDVRGKKLKVPAVFVLHGGGGNADNAIQMTGFISKAGQERFIAVFPNGASRFRRSPKTWNAIHCCAYAMRKKADDIGFISAVIDQIVRDYPADPDRIYMTGMSNGGMMTHRIGRELSKKVAAIAPVVAGLFGDEGTAQNPVPALMINGARDETVPFAGGPLGRRASRAGDGTEFTPSLFQSRYWAENNGCKPEPEKININESVVLLDYDCPDYQDVRHYIVKDCGHAWPGGKKGHRRGDAPSQAMDATRVIWEFFRQQTLKH